MLPRHLAAVSAQVVDQPGVGVLGRRGEVLRDPERTAVVQPLEPLRPPLVPIAGIPLVLALDVASVNWDSDKARVRRENRGPPRAPSPPAPRRER